MRLGYTGWMESEFEGLGLGFECGEFLSGEEEMRVSREEIGS